jgi:hypothetical protein
MTMPYDDNRYICNCGECLDCRITAADRDPLCAAMTAALDAVYRALEPATEAIEEEDDIDW